MADVLVNDSSIGRPAIRSDYSRSSFPALASAQESRRLVRLNPVSGSSFTSRQQIRYNIPAGSDEVWDPINSYLEFTLTPDSTDQIVLKEVGSPGAFSRVTIRNGGNVLEDKTNFPALANFLSLTSDPSDAHERYLMQAQNYNRATSMGAALISTRRIVDGGVKLIWPMSEIGVLTAYQYLPLMYMGASGIALEIILEVAQASDIVKKVNSANATAATTITISNAVLHLEMVKMRKSWVSAGWEHIAARNNIEIPLTVWECQVQNTTNALQQVVRFTSFAQSMKAMVAVIKETIGSQDSDEYITWYDKLPILEYQYRLNVDLYPQEPIVVATGADAATGAARVAAEFLKLLRQFADYSRGCMIFLPALAPSQPWINYTASTGSTGAIVTTGHNFCLPIALDVHLLGEEDDMISGLNLRDKAAPLEILLKFHTAPDPATLYLMMLKDAKLVINEAGCVVYD